MALRLIGGVWHGLRAERGARGAWRGRGARILGGRVFGGAQKFKIWRRFCACGLNFKIWLFDGFLRGIKIFSVAGGFLAQIFVRGI